MGFVDSRDGYEYKTVVIGGQTWMAENLRFNAPGSWCYGDDESNCQKYGRLYTWDTAKAACPGGWHLPTKEEWDTLSAAVGGKEKAGIKLRSKSGWKGNHNGTDPYGFSALPGGSRRTSGAFFDAGDVGLWWTATEGENGYAYRQLIVHYSGLVIEHSDDKINGYSVRCVKDD